MSFLEEKVLTQRNRKALWCLLLSLLCVYIYFGKDYSFIYNQGGSMEPTYKNGELLVVKKIKEEYSPQRFDVVLVRDPEEGELLCKRVMGLPNEKLEMVNGRIYINGRAIHDPFYEKTRYANTSIYKIPKDYIWVIGDDREESIYGIFLIKGVKGLIW